MNPLNQLPTDPALVKRLDEVTLTLAKETGHMVLIVAMRQDGKCYITLEGVPESGPIADIAKEPPKMLAMLAQLCWLHDNLDATEARS